ERGPLSFTATVKREVFSTINPFDDGQQNEETNDNESSDLPAIFCVVRCDRKTSPVYPQLHRTRVRQLDHHKATPREARKTHRLLHNMRAGQNGSKAN